MTGECGAIETNMSNNAVTAKLDSDIVPPVNWTTIYLSDLTFVMLILQDIVA